VTDPLVVARAVHIAATLALVGVVIFGAAVAARALRRTDDKTAAAFRVRLLRIAWLGFALAMISGVAWLVLLLQPTSRMQLEWPFALRYSDAALGDLQLRGKLLFALWTIAGAVVPAAASIVAGFFVRRLRWWLIATGCGIAIAAAILFAPTLSVLTVEAYPTTFYVSPTNYSSSSIVRGAELFATHCASCHGRQGRGDGPAGRFFRVKPSDLTADHVYAHRDGDLYWWIGNGIGDVMPPLGAALDEDARWNVIDFVRANADAARLRDAPAKATNIGYRAPDFFAVCPDGSSVTRDNLRRRIAHLVIADRDTVALVAQVAARERDVITIVIPLDEVASKVVCRTDDPELAKALAIYGGKDTGPTAGTEFLVDPSGFLRAMWAPGRRPDWRDPEVLEREIAAIRDNPVAIPPTGSHLHGR
jgi:mono/diheme cytochrome c family protein